MSDEMRKLINLVESTLNKKTLKEGPGDRDASSFYNSPQSDQNHGVVYITPKERKHPLVMKAQRSGAIVANFDEEENMYVVHRFTQELVDMLSSLIGAIDTEFSDVKFFHRLFNLGVVKINDVNRGLIHLEDELDAYGVDPYGDPDEDEGDPGAELIQR